MHADPHAFLNKGQAATEEALAFFDGLAPVALGFMLGRWRGAGFHTGHPMDGLLEAFNWHGKAFIDPEHVHPLIIRDHKGRLFAIDPAWIPIKAVGRLPIPRNDLTKRLFLSLKWLLKTVNSGARIRMMEHRGTVSAAMIYDRLPIHDHFRRVDDDTLFGLMDLKGVGQPFFFILRRQGGK